MVLRATPKARALIRRVYDEVEFALWALLATFCLYFAIFIAPYIPQMQARQAAARAIQIEHEHDAFCRAIGAQPPSREYSHCVLEAQAFRALVEKRFADSISF